jgi:hypothetical protein
VSLSLAMHVGNCVEARRLNESAALTLQKRGLESNGWTYRAAAVHLDVSYQHLSEVLNGHRQSRRLLRAIANLPARAVKQTKKEAA